MTAARRPASEIPAITFGINTCFAVKRWPQPEAWTQIAVDLGLFHVQFSFDLLDPFLAGNRPAYDRIRTVCEREGITVTSTFTGTIAYAQNLLGHPEASVRQRAEEWLRAAIDATAVLGARGFGGHMSASTVAQQRSEKDRRDSVERTIDSVFRLASSAAASGLEYLVWEVMPVAREYPARLAEAGDLMRRLDGETDVPVELCLDLGHACLAGAASSERDPYVWLAHLGEFARVVHLQQTDGRLDRHWPFTARFNEQGIIDPARVLEHVMRFPRVEVELMLEPIHPFETPDDQVLADLRESVAFWRPALQQASAQLAPGSQLHGAAP